MVAIPIAIYWLFAAWGLGSKRPVLLYLFFLSLPFGSLAVVPPTVTAGLTFTPAPMTEILIILKVFCNGERLLLGLSAMLSFRRLGLLTMFLAMAFVTTMFGPRLFAGDVLIIPLRDPALGKSPLYPTMQNISQLAYLTISVVAVAALTQLLKTPAMRQSALHALLAGAALTVFTGVVDFSSQFVPIAPVLEIFRTATYALLVDAEVSTGKRVVGLMPEASSFGILTLTLLCLVYFSRRAIQDDRLRDVYAPLLIVTLLGFAWLSTSSATYVGLAFFFAIAGLEWLVRFTDRRYNPLRRRYLGIEAAAVTGALVAVALLMLFKPSLVNTVVSMVDQMVFQKSKTSSFEERNMWTTVSLNALWSSYGIGVGLGSTRASNYFVAVLSNVGVIGTAVYFTFIAQSLLRRAAPSDTRGALLISANRYAFVPPFLTNLLIGTTPDFGAFGVFTYAMLTAIGIGGIYGVRSSRTRLQEGRGSPRTDNTIGGPLEGSGAS